MHFTRPRELLVAGVLGLVVGYALFQTAYGALPRMPLAAGAALFVLALVEVVLAFSIRARIKGGRVVGAIAIARSVALAKASSLLGALMLGGWLGATAYLLPKRSHVAAAAADTTSALLGALGGLLLGAAALWLEHCCRTPDRGDSDRPGGVTG